MTAYLQQLFQFSTYKRSQGRIARQVTFIALALMVAAGAWALKNTLEGADGANTASGPIAIGVFAIGCWAAYRLVQLPTFADFLISVEAEMNKVSWPNKSQLWKASVVVMLTIFILAALLFIYDLVWRELFMLITWDDASLIKQFVKGGA